MVIDGIKVKAIGLDDFTLEEARRYVDFVRTQITTPLREVIIKMCEDGKVDVTYYAEGEKFERIRRITGYLTGALDTWNDAKKSEERDRVKHTGRREVFND